MYPEKRTFMNLTGNCCVSFDTFGFKKSLNFLLILFVGLQLNAQFAPCDPAMNACVTQGNNNPINVNLGVNCGLLVPSVAIQHNWQVAASCNGWTRVGLTNRPIQIPPALTPIIIPNSGTCANGFITVSLVAIYSRLNPAPPPLLEFCSITNLDSFAIFDVTNPTLNLPATVILDVDNACTVTEANLLSIIGAANVADNCTDDPTLIANAFIVSGFPVPDLACPTSPNIGTTVVYRTQDACGNLSNTDAVTVRLRDLTPPDITCPADQDRNFNASCQYLVEDFRGLASSTDPCGSPFTYSQRVLAVTNPAEGPFANNVFPTITGGCQGPRVITVRICSQDCFGNGVLDPAPGGPLPINCCTFDITVTDNTPPASNVCPAQTIVNVDAGCTANIPDLRNDLLFTDNCSIIDPSQIGMYCDADGDGTYETELFAPGTPVIPGGNTPLFAGDIICNPLFPNGDVDVLFTFVDCNGNPLMGFAELECADLLRLIDQDAPNALVLCPIPAPIFDLVIDLATCNYTVATVPQDFFNGLAVADDNCDGDAMELNNQETFDCNQLGLQNINIRARDCSGNESGILGQCQVLIQGNPLDAAWTNPGIICMSDLPLDLCALLEPTAATCGYWSGNGISPNPPDNRCNSGSPAMFDPGAPGVYSVTYTVGGPGCHVELTRNIRVEENANPPYLVNDFSICYCPDELIDLETLLLQDAPEGGEWQIISQVPNLGGPSTPGVNILPPTGPGFSHAARYDGGCLVLNLRYTITDCSNNQFTDDIAVTINECPKGSFSVPDDMCQDEGPFIISDTNRVFYGCNDYQVIFDVTSGPSGNLLLGGAPVSGTINTLGDVPVYSNQVAAGQYTIRMRIIDPTGSIFGCPTFVFTQVMNVYKDGESPNGINPVGPLCEVTTGFPVVLSLQSVLDEAGFALTDADVRWTGSGVTDVGVTANFSPADLDGDGLPGPGLFTVCVAVGDPRCVENYCIDILINNDIPDAANDLVQDFKVCATPGTFISYNSLLAAGSMFGGNFSASLSAVSVPAISGLLLPNGFFYTGGCGDLNVTYTLPGDCNPDNVNNDVIVTFCPRPDVEINGVSSLCTRDAITTLTSNMVNNLPQCDSYGSWGSTPATAGLTDNGDGTADFNPGVSGEGSFLVYYQLTTGAGCTDTSWMTVNVYASSDAEFDNPGPLCVDSAPVTLSLNNPDPSVEEGSNDGLQEIFWSSSCGSCLTVTADSVDAIFDPAVAGPGYHLVCVNTGDVNCIDYHCTMIYVRPANDATLVGNLEKGCFDLHYSAACGTWVAEVNLADFYLPQTTRGGFWVDVSGNGCRINNETFEAEPGCHELRYDLPAVYPGATGACAALSTTVFLMITEEPQTNFDMAEEVCWDGIAGSAIIPTYYNGATFGTGASAVTYDWTSQLIGGAGALPTFSDPTIAEPNVIINGAGTFNICLTETLSYEDCDDIVPASCVNQHCEILVVHQTNVEVLPTWAPAGPFCVDDACIDLDVRVSGTPDGVFTGTGVSVSPAHPNYQFCPATAGAGTHTVCYTVQNGAGCTAVECHNIIVYPAVVLNCTDTRDTIQCATMALGPNTNSYGPFNGTAIVSRYTLEGHELNSMLCPGTTPGGAWSYVSGPVNSGAVMGAILYYSTPGCYTVRYTLSSGPGLDGACTSSLDFTIHIGERPNPSMDLPNSVCWDQVSTVTYNIPSEFLTSPTYTGTVARNYRSTNASVVTVSAAGLVTVVGNGTASVCLEEIITTVACAGVTTTCAVEVCEVIRVLNNTTVVNPAWSAIGPFCVTNTNCIDLDALVTGTPNGIFTGQGVQVDGAHPNYCFNPSIAGVGVHAVTYTVNSPDGCTANFTRNIVVNQQCNSNLNLALNFASFGCYNSDQFRASSFGPRNEFDLTRFYLPTTSRGGVWTFVNNPPNTPGPNTIVNETLFGGPGCYTLRYTVSCDPCSTVFSDITFSIVERPTPHFDLAEEACWNGVAGSLSLPIYYNGTTWGTNGTRTYAWNIITISGAGPEPTLPFAENVFQAVNNPNISVNGAGVFEICVTELITYPLCNGVGVAVCTNVYCERIAIHETNEEVNPNWNPIPPLCVDDNCVDLDARVVGNTGGVFTGTGVSTDPTHPEYQFCPGTAGPGTHTICYTVENGAGCTAVECHNVIVYDAVTLACQVTLQDLQCASMPLGVNPNSYGPFGGVTLSSIYTQGDFSLFSMLCSQATRGGAWSYVSGPTATAGAVAEDVLYFTDPGCYIVRYTVSSGSGLDGACTAAQDFQVRVGERPNPSFDLPDAVCWDQVTTVSYNIPLNYLTSPTYDGSVTRNYSSTNTGVATVNAAGVVTIVGNGVTSICMEEIVTTIACDGGAIRCTAQVCEVLRVENNTTVVNPAWSNPGPFCVTNTNCIDLDALVTGTPNGIFTGQGVQVDGAHPNYCFNPSVAGVGVHAVTYTVNSPDGCTAILTRNIEVLEQCNASLTGNNGNYGCYWSYQFAQGSTIIGILFDLSRFYTPLTTRGGVWTIVSSPAGAVINNETLIASPGCYSVTYTVNCDPCLPVSTTINFRIIEKPTPIFDLAEEACWNGVAGSLVLPSYYQGSTWGNNANTRLYNWSVSTISGAGPVPTLSSGVGTFQAINNPTITINGAGVFEICVTERLEYFTCLGIPGTISCQTTYCERITIHQTNTEVNPTWVPLGPLCVDDDCVDLDTRVTGTPDGVFSGTGVSLDPTHPQYQFCPSDAGPGSHTICYTVNNGAGCTAVECHNVVVYPAVILDCPSFPPVVLNCAAKPIAPFPIVQLPIPGAGAVIVSRYAMGSYSLNELLCPGTTRGGTWSLVSAATPISGVVGNDILFYSDPGCYTVRYTVSAFPGADGACTATQDFQIFVGEQPMPMFDLPDELCWDQVSTITYDIPNTYLTSPTYTFTVSRSYSSSNTSVATVNASGLVTIVGNGITRICLRETIFTDACGVSSNCVVEVCEVIRVTNSVTAANPAWNDPGPICVDQACVDLDALVTGTPNGVFTGIGVRPDLAHPQYCFDPAVAGPGVHAVTYTVNSPDGCSGVLTRNIRVYPRTNASLVADRVEGCFIFDGNSGPFHDYDLSVLYTDSTTRGGTWSYISGPGQYVAGEILRGAPGCHQLRYTIPASFPGATGACGPKSEDIFINFSEFPLPDFDMAEEACWNGIPGSLTISTLYTGQTFGDNSTRTFNWSVSQIAGPGPVPTFNNPNLQSPTLTVQGAGTFEVCLVERLDYPTCGASGTSFCFNTHCERIVIHQSSVVSNPAWTPIGPLCVDQPCVDLDARVTGTTGGVFRGVGVRPATAHPQYEFCPGIAGPGTHTVCYTVENGAGCTAVECHNVVVYPAVVLNCADARDTLQCATMALNNTVTNNYGPFGGTLLSSRYTLGTHSLNALLCPNATLGGTWTFVSGPSAGTGTVYDGLLYFTTPGCYSVQYTVSSFPGAMGACTATQTFQVHVGERPNPGFDLPDAVCWDQVNVIQYNIPANYLTSKTASGTITRTYGSNNTSVATVNASGVVTIVGNGIARICMQETIRTTGCFAAGTTCTAEYCEVIRVENNVSVVNPSWTAIGPFCIDDPCVRLDTLVTGTTGGIFTGRGVRPPGGIRVHPEYEFCPAVAGVGVHAVTYTVNSPDGCTGVFTRNIEVYPAANATLHSDSIVCQVEPTGIVDLTALFTPLTTGGGVFTLTSGPATGRVIGDNQLNYLEAGCYCFSYTVSTFPGADGSCTATGTACLLITEQPTPSFDIQNERCWNITDPVALKRDTLFINSPTYDPAGTRTRVLRVLSGPAIVIANGPTIYAVEYTGAGNVVLCLEETLTYAACGTGIPAGRFCRDTVCRQVSVQDGTAQDARFTVIGAKAEYCPGDTITLIPNVPGGIFTGTNVGNSNPVGTSGGVRFTACGIYVVTYTLETPAGCINQSSQTFFTDRTNPVFTGPTATNRFDTVVNCDGTDQTARMTAWANRFTFTDNCQFRVTNRVYDRRSGCSPNTGLYIYEVTGRDTCGNETKVYPSYRVIDTTRPVIVTPASDLVIECGNETDAQILAWLNLNGRAVASDACSNVLRWSHNFSGDIADYCSAVGTLVTFTVFDQCNNSNTTSARIIVRDLIPPVWNKNPVNLTLECHTLFGRDPYEEVSNWLASVGGGVALDSCQLSVRYSNNFASLPWTGGCNRNTGSKTVTFTATDGCGNASSRTATVRIIDITPPEITSPAKDTVVDCDGAGNLTAFATWINNHGGARALDYCSGSLSCAPPSNARAAFVTGAAFPWGSGTYTSNMNAAFGAANWDRLFFATVNPANLFSSSYRFIYIEGGDLNANEFNTFVNNNRALMESWVACGGRLFLNAAPNTGGNIDLGFGGVRILYSPPSSWINNVTQANPHPIFNGPNLPTGINYSGGFYAHALICPPGMTAILRESSGGLRPVLMESFWGSGIVLFGGMTSTIFHSPQPNATNLNINMLEYLENVTLPNSGPVADGILRWDTVRMRTQEDCGGTRILTYMFRAVDSCLNVSNNTIARFIIQDTTDPVFFLNPRDTTVNCDRNGNEAALQHWLQLNGRAIAVDICSGPLRWEHDLVRELDKCSNTAEYTYRFTAIDSCGNSAWREARFIVQDITPPLIDPASGYNKLTSCDQSNAGNDDEIIAWLDSLGGLTATDMCSDVINWRHNFSESRWIRGCGDTRTQVVTFTATDDCGNSSTRNLTVGTIDTTKPVFFNCPRPPIVVAAETFHCDAYVNFSPMAATDNCSIPVINQIDKTGLKSGSRFPVGVTVLVFEAVDGCNNRDTCTLKIIVNDFWDLPSITCPAPVTFVASQDSCGRTLTSADGIDPSNVKDNCPNTVVTFVVTDQNGQIVNSGFNTASGTFFPVGVDTITYCVYDQPLLKLTEVTQQLGTPIAGGTITVGRTNPVPAFITTDLIDGDYIEIGNYGGGIIDMTCLSIEIVGPAGSICDFTIPPRFPLMPMHYLAPGQVATFHVGSGTDVPASRFYHMGCTQAGINDQRAYILRLHDRVIDVVATNGFNPVGRGTIAVVKAEDWVGATDPHFCRGSYYRTNHIDLNRSSDWERAESCNAATIGSWNPTNKFSNANRDTASMQSIAHPAVCCKVPITILDQQAPTCGRYDTLTSGVPTNLNVSFNQGVCYSSTVNITNNCKVGDVRILNMTGSTTENLGDWEVTLISPSGTRVKLWENVCNASTSFNLNFGTSDNKGGGLGSVNLAPCVPNFGNGGFYLPQESFEKFVNEQGQGTWRIEIEDNSCNTIPISNVLTNWRLQVLCKNNANLRDTTITADFRQCRKKFLWFHPLINDNCPGGTMEMTYVTRCTVARTGVVTTVLGPVTRLVTAGACDSLVLPIGTTKISYRLVDRSGNEGMCMFNVTVRDINAPAIPSYKDIIANADAGECGAFVYFTPDAADSCGLDTIWAVPPSGTFFKVGVNRVCIHAIDKSGNRDSVCFNITVNPYIPSSSELSCNDKINLSLDASCRAELTADMILEGGKHWCYDQYEIIVTDSRGQVRSNVFTYADVGKCFKVTIRDPRSGNSCWGEVCVEDKQKPVLACPRDTVVNCISSLDPAQLGYARVTTCEPSARIEYWDEFTEIGECALPYVARIVRYWTVEDESGNRDTCEQRIDVERFDLNDIVWPRHYDDLDLPHLECDKKVNNKDISGHYLDYPYCVDGYLLDSAIWSATGGFYPSPQGDLAGLRLPKALGWNCLPAGNKYEGHPSPYPVYYDPHPGWTPQNGFCWGPDQIVRWTGTGYPTVDGIDLVTRGRCAVSIRYEDEVYDICEDSYEILRYWKVRNMCIPVVAGQNPIEYIQVIKVLDKKGPEIVYPDTIVISTGNNYCTAVWDLAEPWMKDNCSDDLSYSVRMRAGRSIRYADGRWAVINIPMGLHEAELTAQDACGNKTIKKIMVSVVDAIIPTPVCRSRTSVNITGNQSPGENYARVSAESFDEGSYDNCASHLFFKAIRMSELLGTNNGSNSNNTVACNGRNGDDNPILAGNQVYFDDYIDFCCAEAGQRVMVVMRVFDVDPGPGPVSPARMTNRTSPLFGRFNDCMVEVEVQNKNVPTVVAPPNIVVSCWFWFDIAKITDPNDPTFGRVVTDLSDRKKVVTQDIVCAKYCERNDITGYPGFVQTNQVPKPAPNQACEYYYRYFDTAHWDRKYELTWGFDGYALNSCNVSPTITVNDLRECGQGIIQRIVSAQGPNNINVTAIQTIWVVDCDPFYIDNNTCNDPRYSDIMWPNGVCTQTPVTINGCGSDISPDNPQLGRPQVVNNADDNCSLLSIEYFDDVFTIEPDACLKILRRWVVIDWCQYDPFIDPNKGRWERLQVIKVRDQDKPAIICNVGPCEPASINATLGVCVGHISLTATATDNCSPLDWLLWEYKIDAYNDGKGVHGGYDFRVGSLTQKSYAAGDTVEYSHNPFADNAKNPFDASGTYPIGVHKISWFVEDGCGNVGVCESLFEIKDCKAPTPYCHTGIITVPMPTSGCVDIWAKDLDLGSFDNCTPKSDLKFYFDGDENKASITVCCDDFVNAGANDELRIEVEMWVEDEEGNKDYCKTVVIVQDNQDICPNNLNDKARITGLIADENGNELANVEMSLYQNGTMMVQRSGNPYLFGDLKMNVEYEVVPDRNDDHVNGVTTQDIVKIQRHILDLEALKSPYKLLAADVNNTGTITTADIAEIRKLVLGVNSEFAKVRSWSFVPSDYVFADPTNPWKAPRKKTIMLDKNISANFMAFKMGDVTGNAIAGLNGNSQVRTRGQIHFEMDEMEIQAGTDYVIPVKSSDFKEINGYQFTLKFDQSALMYEGFESGKLEMSESNFGLMKVSEGMITTSWHSNQAVTATEDEVLFVLKFKAAKSAKLSQLFAITSDITRAEAYHVSDEVRDVKIGVRTSEGLVESSVFELYQNEPNPVSKQTVISYRLPESGSVRLTIYNGSGKVVRVIETEGVKGLNKISLQRSELMNSSGVLYYQLDAQNHTATKRMIIAE